MNEDNVGYFSLKCPECDTAEALRIETMPTFYIEADINIEISDMKCGNCGYEGEPDGKKLTNYDK